MWTTLKGQYCHDQQGMESVSQIKMNTVTVTYWFICAAATVYYDLIMWGIICSPY